MSDISPVPASLSDADEVFALINKCRNAMKGTGMEQWPDFYPTLDDVKSDIERRSLWILRDQGAVIAAVTIDDDQPEPYTGIEWKDDGPYICVHRLAVDPDRQREGLAARMMEFAHDHGTRGGATSVRVDTYSLNTAANRFYERLGYEKRGTINLPKKPEKYNCMENALPPCKLDSFSKLVGMSRSVRRFREDESIDGNLLEELVGLARLSPSGANRQALKFMLACQPDKTELIFPFLKWAGYIKEWDGPDEGERPSAYIIILGDTEVSKNFGTDHGIAAQSIMLGAAAAGLGGCMIGSIDRKGLAMAFGISDRYEIILVLALGKRAESVVVEDVTEETDIKYWRSADRVHHVPKRSLTDLIIEP